MEDAANSEEPLKEKKPRNRKNRNKFQNSRNEQQSQHQPQLQQHHAHYDQEQQLPYMHMRGQGQEHQHAAAGRNRQAYFTRTYQFRQPNDGADVRLPPQQQEQGGQMRSNWRETNRREQWESNDPAPRWRNAEGRAGQAGNQAYYAGPSPRQQFSPQDVPLSPRTLAPVAASPQRMAEMDGQTMRIHVPLAAIGTPDGGAVAPSESTTQSDLQQKRKRKPKGQKQDDSDQPAATEVPKSANKSENPAPKQESTLSQPPVAPSPRQAPPPAPSPEDERYEAMGIFILKHKSKAFPRARYFCRLCDYHMMDEPHRKEHATEPRHQRMMRLRESESWLDRVPHPTPAQIECLNNLLHQVAAENGLTDEDVAQRHRIYGEIAECLTQRFTDIRLYLIGSSRTGLGLAGCDLNMDIGPLEPESRIELKYSDICNCLRNCSKVENLIEDTEARVTQISFDYEGVQCRITFHLLASRHLAEIFYEYAKVDERVVVLAKVMRHWAKIAGIDDQDKGLLPSYSFLLLLIYYLQQVEPPVLPCFHAGTVGAPLQDDIEDETLYTKQLFEAIPNVKAKFEKKNTMTCAQLWLNMLRFYSFELDVSKVYVTIRQVQPAFKDTRFWSGKRLAIEDPFLFRRNVGTAVSCGGNFDFITEQFRDAYLYFALPRSEEGVLLTSDELIRLPKRNGASAAACAVPSPDECPLALRNETMSAIGRHCVAQGDSLNLLPKSIINDVLESVLTQWTQRRYPLNGDELTIHQKDMVHHLVRGYWAAHVSSESHGTDDDVISAELKIMELKDPTAVQGQGQTAAESDESPTEEELDFYNNLKEHGELTERGVEGGEGEGREEGQQGDEDEVKVDVVDVDIKGEGECEQCGEETVEVDAPSGEVEVEANAEVKVKEGQEGSAEPLATPSKPVASSTELSDENKELAAKMVAIQQMANFHYEFTAEHLRGIGEPTIMCIGCNKEGHLEKDCREFDLPPVIPLPPLTPNWIDVVSFGCWNIKNEFEPGPDEIQRRRRLLNDLLAICQRLFHDIELNPFGSSENGFGFRKSDLDVCATFIGKPCFDESQGSKKAIINKLAKRLRSSNYKFVEILPITQAKVPIVKFIHRETGIEGDISLYNTLALHNTRLLRTYAELDPRCQALGYMMKALAKVCDIADASKGSLSSYAYVLLVIHFLQQCEPPVLPILQQFGLDAKGKGEDMVEGFDCWFFSDIDAIKKRWDGYQRNPKSVGELWIDLVCYYAEKFDFSEHAVCIRQKEPLLRVDKGWKTRGRFIAIEDPFELSHNLGSGVQRKMGFFILKALQSTRERFGVPVPLPYGRFKEYFFDPVALTGKEAPPVGGPQGQLCHRCGKPGHRKMECQERSPNENKQRKARAVLSQSESEMDPRQLFHGNFAMGNHHHQQQQRPYYNRPYGAPRGMHQPPPVTPPVMGASPFMRYGPQFPPSPGGYYGTGMSPRPLFPPNT